MPVARSKLHRALWAQLYWGLLQNSPCSTSEGHWHETLLDMWERRCQQILAMSGPWLWEWEG